MALQYQIDSLDGLDENIAALYTEQDGKFTLDVQGHEKPDNKDKDTIPRHRLNEEIEKRKASEKTLKEVADNLVEDIPEDKRNIVPDLPPAAKIAWLKDAFKMGFFEDKKTESIDSKRPGDLKPTNFDNMSPQAIMATGYGKQNKE
jgi:hypothetical protein